MGGRGARREVANGTNLNRINQNSNAKFSIIQATTADNFSLGQNTHVLNFCIVFVNFPRRIDVRTADQ